MSSCCRTWCPFPSLDVSWLLVDEQCDGKNCCGKRRYVSRARDAERRESGCPKPRYILLRFSCMVFNSKRNLISHTVLASRSSLCLIQDSFATRSCPLRSFWYVVGNRLPIANSKAMPMSDIFLRGYSLSTFDVRRSTCFLVFISMSSSSSRANLLSRRSCCSRSSSRSSRI
jgi:hypothetical protein